MPAMHLNGYECPSLIQIQLNVHEFSPFNHLYILSLHPLCSKYLTCSSVFASSYKSLTIVLCHILNNGLVLLLYFPIPKEMNLHFNFIFRKVSKYPTGPCKLLFSAVSLH